MVVDEPVSEITLAQVLERPVEQIEQALVRLSTSYDERGFALKKIAGGWRFYSHPDLAAVMKTLITRGLVEESGIEHETGAILYITTSYFLDRLGLNALEDLPALAPYLPNLDRLDDILDSLTD